MKKNFIKKKEHGKKIIIFFILIFLILQSNNSFSLLSNNENIMLKNFYSLISDGINNLGNNKEFKIICGPASILSELDNTLNEEEIVCLLESNNKKEIIITLINNENLQNEFNKIISLFDINNIDDSCWNKIVDKNKMVDCGEGTLCNENEGYKCNSEEKIDVKGNKTIINGESYLNIYLLKNYEKNIFEKIMDWFLNLFEEKKYDNKEIKNFLEDTNNLKALFFNYYKNENIEPKERIIFGYLDNNIIFYYKNFTKKVPYSQISYGHNLQKIIINDNSLRNFLKIINRIKINPISGTPIGNELYCGDGIVSLNEDCEENSKVYCDSLGYTNHKLISCDNCKFKLKNCISCEDKDGDGFNNIPILIKGFEPKIAVIHDEDTELKNNTVLLSTKVFFENGSDFAKNASVLINNINIDTTEEELKNNITLIGGLIYSFLKIPELYASNNNDYCSLQEIPDCGINSLYKLDNYTKIINKNSLYLITINIDNDRSLDGSKRIEALCGAYAYAVNLLTEEKGIRNSNKFILITNQEGNYYKDTFEDCQKGIKETTNGTLFYNLYNGIRSSIGYSSYNLFLPDKYLENEEINNNKEKIVLAKNIISFFKSLSLRSEYIIINKTLYFILKENNLIKNNGLAIKNYFIKEIPEGIILVNNSKGYYIGSKEGLKEYLNNLGFVLENDDISVINQSLNLYKINNIDLFKFGCDKIGFDCNDDNENINPKSEEIINNDVDENCNLKKEYYYNTFNKIENCNYNNIFEEREDYLCSDRLIDGKECHENSDCNDGKFCLSGICIKADIGSGCFTPETKIKTPTGEIKIKELKVGDYVLSYDLKNNKIVKNKIKSIEKKKVDKIVIINNKIRTTPVHRLLTNKGWLAVEDIKKGYLLKKISGWEEVKDIKIEDYDGFVYNLHLNYPHNFFANNYLVHNYKKYWPDIDYNEDLETNDNY